MHDRKLESVKNELARTNKSVTEIVETMNRVKACKAIYVLKSTVRTIEDGQTVIKTITTYHSTRKTAYKRMCILYSEVAKTQLNTRSDWVHYESEDGTVVATFELIRPVVG